MYLLNWELEKIMDKNDIESVLDWVNNYILKKSPIYYYKMN